MSLTDLVSIAEDELWQVHDKLMLRLKNADSALEMTGASLLDLKIELARRIMKKCRLCNRFCEVNRINGVQGLCTLGVDAVVAEHFVHIAEEPAVNPSLILSLAGCALGCRFCQQSDLLRPKSVCGERLSSQLWHELSFAGARTISFAGGNPDESLYAVLQFLNSAPKDWHLPVVWNCNGYGSLDALKLLDGVTDIYIPDFKFTSTDCAVKLAAAFDYPLAARESINAMVAQGVPVIVRILVLPCHFKCCHAPSLDYLAQVVGKKLWVSVRGQYYPDWKITSSDGVLCRRPTPGETEAVVKYARDLGLAVI
jgi:putative pyruvate formate lyase activating enzyme